MRELDVQAEPGNIPEVIKFVRDSLDELDCGDKERNQIEVAVEEVFSNISSYAYEPGTGIATVRVESCEDPSSVSICFIDSGIPYDPLAKADPDVSKPLAERQRGGLGIFLTKKFMDDISYEYSDGKNILTIKKLLSGRNG